MWTAAIKSFEKALDLVVSDNREIRGISMVMYKKECGGDRGSEGQNYGKALTVLSKDIREFFVGSRPTVPMVLLLIAFQHVCVQLL